MHTGHSAHGQEPGRRRSGGNPHPGPPANPGLEAFLEAVDPAIRQLAEEADVPLRLLNPDCVPLRDRVSENAIFGPVSVDDMATTGRFFSWTSTGPKSPLEEPPSDAQTYSVTSQETRPVLPVDGDPA